MDSHCSRCSGPQKGSAPVCVDVGMTDCEFFDVIVSSVKFDEREKKSGESSKTVPLGGTSVRVWCLRVV